MKYINLKSASKLQVILLLTAFFYLTYNINQFPFVDADEALFASITTDTLASTDILSIKNGNINNFELPPMQFWLAMISIKTFGENEFAFRLPSILISLLSLWLVFLIIKKITNNDLISAAAFLILLFSSLFYAFTRELRLDPGVIMSMMLTLFILILGWQKQKYLIFIFPAMIIGFYFKSYVAFLTIPILAIYSIFYKKWSWLKSIYLWIGLAISLIMFLPWHAIQYMRYGNKFIQAYFIDQLFKRLISEVIETSCKLNYFNLLWEHYQPWSFVILLLTCFLIAIKIKRKNKFKEIKDLLPPFLSALFILLLFSTAKTRLSTYILPALPFLAMFIAMSFYYMFNSFNKAKLFLPTFIMLLVIGGIYNSKAVNSLVRPFHFEEKDIGLILKKENINNEPFYVLDWPHHQSIRYYGGKEFIHLNSVKDGNKALLAPFYLLTNTQILKFFYTSDKYFITDFNGVKELYRGNYLFLMHSNQDITLPGFK